MTVTAQLGTEREQLLDALHRSRETYLASVKNVPDCAASVRLNDDSWSILEIAEHIAVAEHGMVRAIELGTEKTSPPNYDGDTAIVNRGVNRDIKIEAPERSRPKGRWTAMAEAVAAFEISRANTITLVEKGERDPRKIECQHPLFGPLDGHQVLLLMSAHLERHTAQIEEIKQTATYKAAGK
jgi:hypothetical protein